VNPQKKTVRILASFEKQSKSLLVFEGFFLIGIIGFVDCFTGDLGFSVFYVLPIFLITWFANQRFGFVASFASAIIWLAADITTTQLSFFPFIQVWNSFIRLAFFIIITILLSSLKSSLELAHTDHLTSAINSRYFYEIVQMEINRIQRNQHPFTVAYIDLDDFKAVNDQLGHTVGDQVLVTLVSSVSKIIRKSDFVARLGGDEFAVLFPETDQEAARIIFSKIQNGFVETMQQKNWSVTLSVGILTCRVAPQTTDELIRMADELMYLAKSDGKNTVRYSTYAG
jgi:diguanylate cyclase (GGDEF)-like protein